VSSTGCDRFVDKRWNCVLLAVAVLSLADMVLLRTVLGFTLRPMRVLRPLFLIAHVRALRQQLTTIFNTLPRLVDIFVRPTLTCSC
jgi:hypothetical protein